MRSIAAALLFLLTLVPPSLFGQKNVIDFFRLADSLSQTPPMISELSILGQKKVMNRYVTIVGYPEDKSVLLVAVTLEPIKDIRKDISLAVRFKKTIPDVGKTSSWGYIFDRNQDGQVDYMTLLGGGAAFKDELFPEDYPYKDQALQGPQMEYFISHTRLVFNHWADDNFDGTLDAVIHVDMDPDRDFVERQIVARSTAFNGRFDDVWAFRVSDGALQDSVPHTETSVPYHPIGKPPDAITPAMLADKSQIMKLINTALKQSKLTSKNFSRFSKDQ